MQYIKGLDAFDGRNHTAVTLGKFDGLHRGHQKLLNRIMKYAQKEDCDSVVCAFDMDRDCLMTNEERRAFLEDKVDYLIEIPFTREMMEMEAEKFIDEILHKKLHASHIVVGTDFNFGHEKRGNHQMLEKYAAKYGYTVDVVEKAYYKDREISSTYIRELLLDGNVPLANELLGYPYEITSVVEHGQQLGRTLGFPTMNLAPQEKKILPKYGVYACRVLVDGVWYGGVGNAGVKPTVAQEKRRLFEVYVYGYEGDAYGKTATVQILEFERPETKFHSVEELKDRVMKDMRYGEEYLKNHPFDDTGKCAKIAAERRIRETPETYPPGDYRTSEGQSDILGRQIQPGRRCCAGLDIRPLSEREQDRERSPKLFGGDRITDFLSRVEEPIINKKFFFCVAGLN